MWHVSGRWPLWGEGGAAMYATMHATRRIQHCAAARAPADAGRLSICTPGGASRDRKSSSSPSMALRPGACGAGLWPVLDNSDRSLTELSSYQSYLYALNYCSEPVRGSDCGSSALPRL